MSVYADDRNAASPSAQAMAQVEGTWQVVEDTTALRNNEGKTKRWHVFRKQGRWHLEGCPAKALGVELPTPKVHFTAGEEAKLA
eukprot:13819603-Alexandrium_andersonii.AAC.1